MSILNEKYSVADIAKTFIPILLLTSVTYQIHLTNKQMERIQKDYLELKNKTIEKDNLILELQRKLMEKQYIRRTQRSL